MGKVIRNFPSEHEANWLIISARFFDQDKPFILIEIPFFEKNWNKLKNFINKFFHFTNRKYCISINQVTKKVKSLFSLKRNNINQDCKIYNELCSCKEKYIDEWKPNTAIRWEEHNITTSDFEPGKYLNEKNK